MDLRNYWHRLGYNLLLNRCVGCAGVAERERDVHEEREGWRFVRLARVEVCVGWRVEVCK